ncbi:hypothetical protein HPB48_020657 [Haemaphysalis longicornis]|uniref:Uncharacterized protein n=1 Tax=Haemaphysalis longicornis TaxID=44386 RepID=A0A9J6FLM5_HAELO|nr:hypothetical protein HPB48_020657 [Haemaphysalis longicornis]
MGALYQGDCLEDDFDQWLEETDSWIDRVYQLNGDVDAPPERCHLALPDRRRALPDAGRSLPTTTEIWPKLCQFVDLCPEVKFGGWARTKVAYVPPHQDVDGRRGGLFDWEAGRSTSRASTCRILPVRIYPC